MREIQISNAARTNLVVAYQPDFYPAADVPAGQTITIIVPDGSYAWYYPTSTGLEVGGSLPDTTNLVRISGLVTTSTEEIVHAQIYEVLPEANRLAWWYGSGLVLGLLLMAYAFKAKAVKQLLGASGDSGGD